MDKFVSPSGQHTRHALEVGLRQESTDCDLTGRILGSLQRLERGQDEIRRQLAGHAKSHLTVEEVGELVGRAPYTIRRWVAEGRISAIRVTGSGPKGRLLVPRDQLDELLRSGKGGNVPEAAIPQRGLRVE